MSGRRFLCTTHTGVFTVAEMVWLQNRGKERGSVRDDVRDESPVCITQLTLCSTVEGCPASECNAAWSRDSWDHCAQCQPGGRQHMPHEAVACLHVSDYHKLSQHLPLPSRPVPVPMWLGQASPSSVNIVRK